MIYLMIYLFILFRHFDHLFTVHTDSVFVCFFCTALVVRDRESELQSFGYLRRPRDPLRPYCESPSQATDQDS